MRPAAFAISKRAYHSSSEECAFHWIGTLRSIFLQLDNIGRILRVDDRPFHSDFDDASYQQGLQRGITDTRRVRLLPAASSALSRRKFNVFDGPKRNRITPEAFDASTNEFLQLFANTSESKRGIE